MFFFSELCHWLQSQWSGTPLINFIRLQGILDYFWPSFSPILCFLNLRPSSIHVHSLNLSCFFSIFLAPSCYLIYSTHCNSNFLYLFLRVIFCPFSSCLWLFDFITIRFIHLCRLYHHSYHCPYHHSYHHSYHCPYHFIDFFHYLVPIYDWAIDLLYSFLAISLIQSDLTPGSAPCFGFFIASWHFYSH